MHQNKTQKHLYTFCKRKVRILRTVENTVGYLHKNRMPYNEQNNKLHQIVVMQIITLVWLCVNTPWAIKRSKLLSELRQKSTDFNAVFTVRFNDERYTWRYEHHPPYLINVATLPCEILNTAKCNINIVQCDITKEKLHQMYHTASSKRNCRV